MRGSIEKYEFALAKDPTFALAHVGIADAYIFLSGYSFSIPKISMSKAERELLTALKMNPDLPEVYASFGHVKSMFNQDWIGSEEYFKKAITINPNYPEAHRWYSHLLLLL